MRRFLKRNHRSGTPSLLVAFDCETTDTTDPDYPRCTVQRLFLGWAVRWRLEAGKPRSEEWLRFTRPEQFMAWLLAGLDPRKRTWVWAHNLAFDSTAVWFWRALETGQLRFKVRRRGAPARDDDDDETPLLVTSDPPTIYDTEDARGRSAVWVDAMNFLPYKLAELGGWAGIEKLPFPSDSASEEDWCAYCRRDVEILQSCVNRLIAWVKDNDLGNLRYTLAGQSLALFRHLLGEGKGELPVCLGQDPDVKAWERQAYYGMGVHDHFRGAVVPANTDQLRGLLGVPAGVRVLAEGPVYKCDVNSCYTHAMAEGLYPSLEVMTIEDTRPARLLELLEGNVGVAQVLIRSDETPYPHRSGNQVEWCKGAFKSHLCGAELVAALRRGEVYHVAAARLYRAAPLFSRFVAKVWEMRAAAIESHDLVTQRLVKDLGNALHGKLGQKSGGWQFTTDYHAWEPWGTSQLTDQATGRIVNIRAVAHRSQVQLPPDEHPDGNPLIAACVTAQARVHLAELVELAGLRGVVYQDADSLHLTAAGYARLSAAGRIDPHRPGALKVDNVAQIAVYEGPKRYRLDGRLCVSGRPSTAYRDPQGMWRATRFMRLDAMLNGKPPPGPITIDEELKEWSEPEETTRNADGWLAYRMI